MTERPTPLTDANAAALEAYTRKINEAARGPYGTTIRMPDPDAPQGIYELARTLERDRSELMEVLKAILVRLAPQEPLFRAVFQEARALLARLEK